VLGHVRKRGRWQQLPQAGDRRNLQGGNRAHGRRAHKWASLRRHRAKNGVSSGFSPHWWGVAASHPRRHSRRSRSLPVELTSERCAAHNLVLEPVLGAARNWQLRNGLAARREGAEPPAQTPAYRSLSRWRGETRGHPSIFGVSACLSARWWVVAPVTRCSAEVPPTFRRPFTDVPPTLRECSAADSPTFRRASADAPPTLRRCCAGVAPTLRRCCAGVAPVLRRRSGFRTGLASR